MLLVQEKLAGPIAEKITREKKKINSAKDLADLVADVYKKNKERGKIQPATKTFLALRMLVNKELENLQLGIEGGLEILRKGGRLAVITFHSTEDRLVKKMLPKGKLIFPSREEIRQNPLARSAKLRILEKS